ncbi:NADH dehydrogenase/NADH:ubiquinone oxidoreductase subunit G [Microbacterium sp. SLBN-111]
MDCWVQSACVLGSNGCGTDIAVKDGQMVGVGGRAVDIANHGRLGPGGLFGSWQGVANADRLTRPLIRENGELVETDWTPRCRASSEAFDSVLGASPGASGVSPTSRCPRFTTIRPADMILGATTNPAVSPLGSHATFVTVVGAIAAISVALSNSRGEGAEHRQLQAINEAISGLASGRAADAIARGAHVRVTQRIRSARVPR